MNSPIIKRMYEDLESILYDVQNIDPEHSEEIEGLQMDLDNKINNLLNDIADLEEDLNRSVDIVRYREKMNAFLKAKIEKEAIYV